MAYAALTDVKARAGGVSEAWGENTSVAEADIEVFLEQVAQEIDSVVASRGFAVPVTDDPSMTALRGTNADGAMVLALEATFPSAQSRVNVVELLNAARARYALQVQALQEGTHPAIAVLEGGPGGLAATSFWIEEPNYDQVEMTRRLTQPMLNPSLEPEVRRGMKF